MRKKVLLELCLSPDLGGLELYMLRASQALRDRFDLISVISEDTELERYYEDKDRYLKIKKKGAIGTFLAARELALIIDKHSVDIVHAHWTKDLLVAVLAKTLAKSKPKIVQTRNMTMTRFKDDFYHRWIYKNITLMLPVTHQVKEQLKRFIPAEVRPQIEVLYMGSDKPTILDQKELKEFKNKTFVSQDSFNIGLVGRINEAKGQHLLIEALHKIEDSRVEVYFVGHEMREGYIDKLKKESKILGIQDRVHFLGFMKNPHHFFQACDVIVMASKKETFGLVVIEAMQAQTAVVGSNSGGVVEIIDDERTGLLFEASDSSSLALKIQKLIDNPDLLSSIVKAANIECEKRFSSKKQFDKLAKILECL